jgi:hypothetical protein
MIALNPYHFHKLQRDVNLPSLKCRQDKEETSEAVVVLEFELRLTGIFRTTF